MNMPLVLLNRRRRGFTAFSPSTLFALAEPGVWFDPSDLTTLFTDPAGTTPVTAPGNTVGLMLDKSRGGEQSLPVIGWTVNSGDGVVTIVDNVITITGATITTRVDITSPGWVAGDYIKATVNSSIGSSTGAAVFLGGVPYGASAGTATYASINAGGSLRVQVGTGTATFTVTARSRTPGNHATQGIFTSRPTYSIEPVGGRRNLLTWSEGFDNAIWLKPAGTSTVTPNTAIAPDGTMTADLVTATAGNACHYVAQNSVTGAVTLSVYAKAGTANWLGLGSGYTNGVETAWFDLATGTRGTVASGGTSTMDPVAGYPGWWRCSHTRASWSAGAALPFVTNANGVAAFNAVGTENLLLWGAQLELGSTATAYQRVTTQHDVTEAGVASVSYLYFDGTDDAMTTSTVTAGTDKTQIFTGIRKLANPTEDVLFGFGSSSILNGFELQASFYFSSPKGIGVFSLGPGYAGAYVNNVSAPISLVYTGTIVRNQATAAETYGTRINSVTQSQIFNTGGGLPTGNFSSFPVYLGGRAGTSIFFTGHLYSLITRFGPTLDAPTIASTETWVAGKTGLVI